MRKGFRPQSLNSYHVDAILVKYTFRGQRTTRTKRLSDTSRGKTFLLKSMLRILSSSSNWKSQGCVREFTSWNSILRRLRIYARYPNPQKRKSLQTRAGNVIAVTCCCRTYSRSIIFSLFSSEDRMNKTICQRYAANVTVKKRPKTAISGIRFRDI